MTKYEPEMLFPVNQMPISIQHYLEKEKKKNHGQSISLVSELF